MTLRSNEYQIRFSSRNDRSCHSFAHNVFDDGWHPVSAAGHRPRATAEQVSIRPLPAPSRAEPEARRMPGIKIMVEYLPE